MIRMVVVLLGLFAAAGAGYVAALAQAAPAESGEPTAEDLREYVESLESSSERPYTSEPVITLALDGGRCHVQDVTRLHAARLGTEVKWTIHDKCGDVDRPHRVTLGVFVRSPKQDARRCFPVADLPYERSPFVARAVEPEAMTLHGSRHDSRSAEPRSRSCERRPC